jgi:hypothetical protein
VNSIAIYAALISALVVLLGKLLDRRESIADREKRFLEGQVTYHTQLEVIARNRTNKVLAELDRCNAYIPRVQAIVRVLVAELRGELCGTCGRGPRDDLSVPEFEVRGHAEIFGPEEIPLPPLDAVTSAKKVRGFRRLLGLFASKETPPPPAVAITTKKL